MTKYLINYADKNFTKSQKKNSVSGINIGGFDKVIEYSRKDIDTDFYTKNQIILDSTRGAGYWLWKPYIIKKTLDRVNDGDIIFYCDAGSHFESSMKPLFNIINNTNQDIIPFQLTNLEKHWTKADVFVLMELDFPEYYNTLQRLSGFHLLRKSEFTVKFYDEFLKYAQNINIISDLPNICGKKNYDGFRENRHDQSIFSLLTKKYKLKSYPDPSVRDKYIKGKIINLTRCKD